VSKTTCNECRFFHDDFTCRRNPPSIYLAPTGPKQAWPKVSPFVDWCGELMPKTARPPSTWVSSQETPDEPLLVSPSHPPPLSAAKASRAARSKSPQKRK